MCSWQVLQICWGETSVEGHDNAYYTTRAKQDGREWQNRWDLGWRRNLELFFNVGAEG
jgi:palmitoyltransferase